MGSYKLIKASHFTKSATVDCPTHVLNFEIVRTEVEMMSEADSAFLHVHLDHVQAKSWSQDYTISSGLAIWLQNLNCARTWRTATMPRKYSFQEHWRKDGAYLEWVLKDNLDARYAWCMAFEIQLSIFFFFFYYCDAWWSIHNLILVLTSPYKVLIWF